MNIEITHRLTKNTLLARNVESIKSAAELAVKDGATLSEANLDGASLRGASLRGASLRGANLREVNLRGANLREVNLRGATLDGATLSGANLDGASLRGASLDGEVLKTPPLSILNLTWPVLITGSYMRIGCQRHTHKDWEDFTEEQILKMASGAADFWRKNRIWLLSSCDAIRESTESEE